MRKLTQEEFICRSKIVHGEFYDYSRTTYKTVNDYVDIICPIHGIFSQRGDHHLEGRRCKLCSTESSANVSKQEKDKELFFRRASIKWNGKYTYDESSYITARKVMKICCPTHGEFWQTPSSHLKSQCSMCANQVRALNQTLTTTEFVSLAKKVHVELFSYNNTVYTHNKVRVQITCAIHGDFLQTPNNHLMGKGCPNCKSKSKNETIIETALKADGVVFERQKTFPDCRNPKTNFKLRFDFYLPDLNMCIEFDGRQHFESIPFWGGAEALENNKYRDKIKSLYCRSNGISLFRLNNQNDVKGDIEHLISDWEMATKYPEHI